MPFILVGNYPTIYYATLGPSRLRPPFARVYNLCVFETLVFVLIALGRRQTLFISVSFFQSPVFLINSRLLQFILLYFLKHPSSLSYWVNLQSSFTVFFSVFHLCTFMRTTTTVIFFCILKMFFL